ncbi:MAG: hypothetical protein D6753_04825 [Planctomycetota bacterium]|nr:MAG: hypothetical protein D6753_04825 [Planctomycetota bacterium]
MGLPKPVTGLLLLAGAAGGPYLWYRTDVGKQASNAAQRISGQATMVGQADPSQSGFWNANGMELIPPADAGADLPPGPRIYSLQEVLRFDISPAWVMQRFPRVSTVLSETRLDGMRVPLVTGTAITDLAGTLTYYFDGYQRVQRIQVHAVTGDPTRFVAELQHAYGLQQHPALGGTLYLLKWNGRPTCVVFAAPAPIITSEVPQARFNVFIELNQAGLEFGLSEEAQALVESGRHSGRW